MNAPARVPWLAALQALRPHQWAKNLIVLFPVATAHAWDRLPAALLAMAGCCAAASLIYLVNDWCDRAADAQHARKRHRAIARGALNGFWVVVLGILLALIATAFGLLAGGWTPYWLAGYTLLACAYSAWLKRVLVLDVVLLTGFYLVRLGLGAAAVAHALSPWLAVFAAGVFGSLACLKRAAELSARGCEARRAWRPHHIPALTIAGGIAAAVALITLIAYPLSATAHLLYPHPWWLAMPALPLAWWLVRAWKQGRAGNMSHDPVAHALRDPGAWLVVASAALACGLGVWR